MQFIDLELAGTHYMAFDLAKLWRRQSYHDVNDTIEAANRQRLFLETYSDATIGRDEGDDDDDDDVDAMIVELEN